MQISSALMAATLALVSCVSVAAQTYSVTDLGTLGSNFSSAVDINNSGQVVGTSTFASDSIFGRGFLYSNGAMRDLSDPGGRSSLIEGLNGGGQVVGTFYVSDGRSATRSAFLYANGSLTDLENLGEGFAAVKGITDDGRILGVGATVSGQSYSFVYRDGQIIQTLFDATAEAINSISSIVGSRYDGNLGLDRAFLYDSGIFTALGTLGGQSRAASINEAGQIVGWSSLIDGTGAANDHAFLFDSGTMTDLGSLTGAGGYSTASDINNHGEIVGSSMGANGSLSGFVYRDGVMTDLNELNQSEWAIHEAVAINDSGQIVANGCVFDISGGRCHALLLAPVPETETYLMMLVGLGVVVMAFRRKRSPC